MDLLASAGATTLAALVASGFAVGVGVLNFLGTDPGEATEEEKRIARKRFKRRRKLEKKARKREKQKLKDSQGDVQGKEDQEDEAEGEPAAAEVRQSAQAEAEATTGTSSASTVKRRRRRGKHTEFDGDTGGLETNRGNTDSATPEQSNGANKSKKKNKKGKKKSKHKDSSDEPSSDEDVDDLFNRALKGDEGLTNKQTEKVLDEFGDRLTRTDLPEDIRKRRDKMLSSLGLDETKIRLAVHYAKQGKRVPLTRAQKVTACVDAGVFFILLAVLVVLVVQDFRAPILLWVKTKMPREYKIMETAVVDFLGLWNYVFNHTGTGTDTAGSED